MGTLTILVLNGPYSSRHPELACEIAEEALKKGHGVNMIFYMDGVHVPKKGQVPKDFKTISEALTRLLEKKGFNAVACEMSAHARGYVKGEADASGIYPTDEYVDGVKIMSIHEFGKSVKGSEKIIALNV
ncbi:MAG TPA: DsrE family protein [Candidatus Bathyarchaeia archaeon]